MTQTRVIAGAAVVAAAAILAAANSYHVAAELRHRYHDPYGVESAQQRLEGVGRRVARDAALGYLSDLAVNSEAGTAAFLAAQHALAPHILISVEGGGPEWAVGNFARPADYAAVGEKAGYSVAEDLGNGVLLYRRTKR